MVTEVTEGNQRNNRRTETDKNLPQESVSERAFTLSGTDEQLL